MTHHPDEIDAGRDIEGCGCPSCSDDEGCPCCDEALAMSGLACCRLRDDEDAIDPAAFGLIGSPATYSDALPF